MNSISTFSSLPAHAGPRTIASYFVHSLDERPRPVGRMKRDHRELPRLDPTGDFADLFGRHVLVSSVSPKDEHVAPIEILFREPVLGIVEFNRSQLTSRPRLQLVGEVIAQKSG